MKYNLYTGGFQAFMRALVLSTTLKNKEMLFELGDEQDHQVLLRTCNEGFIDPSHCNFFDESATLFCVKGVLKANDCHIVLYFKEERNCRVYEVERLKEGEALCIVDDLAVEDILRCTQHETLNVIEMIELFFDFGIETLYMSDEAIEERRAAMQA